MQYIGIVRNPEPRDSEESSTDHVKILQNQPSLRSTRRAGFYGIKKRKKRTFVVQEEKRRRRRAALFVLPARDVVSFVLRVSRLGGVVRGARVIPVVAQFVCFAKLRRVFVCAVAHGFILHGAPGFDDGESEGIAGAVLAGRDGERVPRPVRGGHLDTLVVPPVPAVPSGGAPDELHPAHGPRHTGHGTWRFHTSSETPHRCTVKVTGDVPEPSLELVRASRSVISMAAGVMPSTWRTFVDVTAATTSIAPAAIPSNPNPLDLKLEDSVVTSAFDRGTRGTVSGFCGAMAKAGRRT